MGSIKKQHHEIHCGLRSPPRLEPVIREGKPQNEGRCQPTVSPRRRSTLPAKWDRGVFLPEMLADHCVESHEARVNNNVSRCGSGRTPAALSHSAPSHEAHHSEIHVNSYAQWQALSICERLLITEHQERPTSF